MFPLLAGVLAAGNVCFDDHGDGNAATVLRTPDNALSRTAACLGVDAAALEAALTSVTLLVGRGGGGGGGGLGRSGSRAANSWIIGGSSVREREAGVACSVCSAGRGFCSIGCEFRRG